MSTRQKFLVLLVVLCRAIPAFAKAYYAGKEEMIKEAECIAIVRITKVETVKKQGKLWTYRQKALGEVERSLKGNAKGKIEVYGMETFICAQCTYEKGRFLLFLRKEKNFWVGSNWHLGIRPITDDKVQWFKNDQNRYEMKASPLADVIAEIETIVKKDKEKSPNKGMESDKK